MLVNHIKHFDQYCSSCGKTEFTFDLDKVEGGARGKKIIRAYCGMCKNYTDFIVDDINKFLREETRIKRRLV